MLGLEILLTAIVILMGVSCRTFRSEHIHRAGALLCRFSYHRNLSIALVGMSALLLRLALLPVLPVPQPSVPDEFSYLLNADTFLHGRVTNPVHPLWVHFESFDIVQQPTYASIYPPLQGLFLAGGKLLLRNPFWGVWLSVGVLCAALCWMLQAWVSPPWALVGGMLSVARIGSFSYWTNSYMVPAVAAIGGAFVLGAVPRIKRSPTPTNAITMAVGLAILANSRPYEGLILSIPAVMLLLIWIFKDQDSATAKLMNVFAPACVVLIVTAAFMGYYNWRVTGSWLLMPHSVAIKTYCVTPKFLWQKPQWNLHFHHQLFRDYNFAVELPFYQATRSPTGLAAMTFLKTVVFWLFYIGPLFTVPLILACANRQFRCEMRGRSRLLVVTSAVFACGLAFETIFNTHYAAPAMALLMSLIVISMRALWDSGAKVLIAGIVLAAFALVPIRAAAHPLHLHLDGLNWGRCWWSPWKPEFGRANIVAQLNNAPGGHLVIVRYSTSHDANSEWVYNDADINASKIVWARDMDGAHNQELIRYFRNRQVWLLEPDQPTPHLSQYQQPQLLSTGQSH